MKQNTKIKLIYIRYIAPCILLCLIFGAMFIPSFRYAANGQINDSVSAIELLKNTYNESREALFGTEERSGSAILFSKVALTTECIFALLTLLSVAVAVYTLVAAIRYFAGEDEEKAEQMRTLYRTLIPNRIVLCILNTLSLSLALFPYIMPLFYKLAYDTSVVLVYVAPEALLIGGIPMLALFVLSCVTARFERELDADLFKKYKMFKEPFEQSEADEPDGEYAGDEYTSLFSTAPSDGDERRRQERNEEIRRIFLNDKNDGGADDTDGKN